MTTVEKIQKYMNDNDITGYLLEELTDISQTTWHRIRHNKVGNVSKNTLKKFCEAFKLDIADFKNDENESPKTEHSVVPETKILTAKEIAVVNYKERDKLIASLEAQIMDKEKIIQLLQNRIEQLEKELKK